MTSHKTAPLGARSCHKHTKSKQDEISTHIPTIKCHEEVMSKLSSCTNEECVGDRKSWGDQTCHHREQKIKKVSARTETSKCKLGLQHSVSAPGNKTIGYRNKDFHPKTVKSKSIPIIQTNDNLEDSVDFIPVKLTPNQDRKQRPQKNIRQHFESRSGQASKANASKCYRPTWDEILRNNLDVSNRPKRGKSPLKKSMRSDNLTKCRSEQTSSRPNTPKKKDSAKKSDEPNCQGLDELRQNCCNKQLSEISKSTESSNSKKMLMFENIDLSDPIKTLDFLIRQLRDGLLKKPQNDGLQNIILDIENALLKISAENKSHSNHPLDRTMYENEDFLDNEPQSAVSDIHDKTKCKHMDIMQLEHNLEKSCRYLQSLCIKQKESCSNHLREKEQLSLQLAESRRLLAISKSKEKNYEVTLGELRLKLQEANTKIDQLKQSLQDVELKNATLKEENQSITSLRKTLKKVGIRLKQISSEKEVLKSKLSIKDLEIEKLKVLLQVKTGEKTDLKQDSKLPPYENELDAKISNDDKHASMISLSTVTSWSEGPGLICSSQASSSPRHSPSPYNSWQNISSIVQQPSAAADIDRGIAVILQELKAKSEQMEPLRLDLQNPSSSSSLWSDREAVGAKVVYSDGESESFSS